MTGRFLRTGKDRLRRKLEALYRELWSILVLVNGLSHTDREGIRGSIGRIVSLPRKELLRRTPVVEEQVAELRAKFAISAPGSVLYQLLTDDKKRAGLNFSEWRGPLPVGQRTIFLSKYALEKLVPRYELVLPDFSLFPPHAMFAIDLVGEYDRGETEIYTLEGSLFEDMAALWNATSVGRIECRRGTPKSTVKRVLALNRATAKAAFGLLEGYVNGLAVDILAVRRVSDEEKAALKEWDAAQAKPKTITLKQKLLRYPRIALAAERAVVDDRRCAAMGRVLAMEPRVRHSLVHPTPRIPRSDQDVDREIEFRSLDIDEVGRLCDDVIETIFAIDEVLGGVFGRASKWLVRRGESGVFGEEAFR
jgi:hypothetical protein